MRDIDFSTAPFQLSDLQAWQVMEDHVDVCRASISCQHATELLIKRGRGCLPVVDDQDVLVGFISEYDLLKLIQEGEDLAVEPVCNHMVRDVVSVFPESSVMEVLNLLENQHYLRIPVVEDGRLKGLISRRDILFASLKGKAQYYRIP